MKKKRSLLDELNLGEQSEINSPYKIDVQKVKGMVNDSINSPYTERKLYFMKSKKIAIIAAALVFVLGISVFAASGIIANWNSSSSSNPEYKDLPTEKQVAEDIGYEVVLIDVFENGYTFKSGSVINNNLTDENNNSVEKFKSVMFRYEKDGDEVVFSQDKFNSDIEASGEVIASVDGIDIYYYSYTNKLVPDDYKLTEEDKRAEENGELVFSYGMDEVTITNVQGASWMKDGMRYDLMQIDGRLSADELTAMAEEVIEK